MFTEAHNTTDRPTAECLLHREATKVLNGNQGKQKGGLDLIFYKIDQLHDEIHVNQLSAVRHCLRLGLSAASGVWQLQLISTHLCQPYMVGTEHFILRTFQSHLYAALLECGS